MTKLNLIIRASAAALALGWAGAAAAQEGAPPPPAPAAAAPAAPAPSPMPNPAITAPMAANPYPASFDAGPLGKITVDGVLSGLALYQTPNPTFAGGPDHNSGYLDLSNAQLILNKSDGPIQFYVQAGAYSLPALGATYFKATTITPNTFGYVPQGFIKLVPSSQLQHRSRRAADADRRRIHLHVPEHEHRAWAALGPGAGGQQGRAGERLQRPDRDLGRLHRRLLFQRLHRHLGPDHLHLQELRHPGVRRRGQRRPATTSARS